MMAPSPTKLHQNVCRRLANLLEEAVPANEAEVTVAWGWRPAADEFIPDVIVHPVTEETVRFTGMPLLVVDVLSGNRCDDLVRKATKYAALGLIDYWIVDPLDHAVESYVTLAELTTDSVHVDDNGSLSPCFTTVSVHLDGISGLRTRCHGRDPRVRVARRSQAPNAAL